VKRGKVGEEEVGSEERREEGRANDCIYALRREGRRLRRNTSLPSLDSFARQDPRTGGVSREEGEG
jgi:hypothetical protein